MRALIISLNFHPGHISHAIACYKQCEELGYDTSLYMNPMFSGFISGDYEFVSSESPCPETDLAIFLFPSQKNLKLIFELKRKDTVIAYIFHEPIASFKEYRDSGYTRRQLVIEKIKHWVSAFTVKLVDVVLLPSNKAVNCYESNRIYSNGNYHYLPLMYDDEMTQIHDSFERKFFSYIGTVAPDHSFQEYLDFVCHAVGNNLLEDTQFLIATKSSFDVPLVMKDSPRVTILQGKPLSNNEINACYASSFVVWNAYARTTQSGVLAKSFMFGTPAIVLAKNCNEFAHDGIEIKVIEDNTDVNELLAAVDEVQNNFNDYSGNCRKRFLNSFYYRKYNDYFKNILEKCN